MQRTLIPENAAAHDVIAGVGREHDILTPDRDAVANYLDRHVQLLSLLPSICKRARDVFGADSELSLQLYVDPEIDDRYLTLYVRPRQYPSNIIDQIEAVSAEFHEPLETVPGYLLITTDFRRPRGADAV